MADGDLPSYPVKEDMRFQKTVWIIERVSWILLTLVPLAALAGIFSHGPLSDRIAQAPNEAWSLEYERFQRVTVQSRFVIRVPAAQGEEVRVHLSPSFQQSYDIQSMQPDAERGSADADGLYLFFRTNEGELTAVIWATPRRFGSVNLRAETEDGVIELPILIYP
jgi:hypothetical protein